MSFVKSMQWVSENIAQTPEFYDAEVLTVYFETTTSVVEKLLPPPLEPASPPLGIVFVANYPSTSFGLKYRESGLSCVLLTREMKEATAFRCLLRTTWP